MLEFLAPAWWWALPALAVPVLVHLWSRREPRPIRVGSVRFLEEAAASRARSFHLTELPLLAVRLLVLGALVALLARPSWRDGSPSGAPEPARWALVHPEAGPAGSTPAPETVDSLASAGFDPRFLAPGWPSYPSGLPDPDASSQDIWSLLRQADADVPGGSEIAVVAPARAELFSGPRPVLEARVTWIEPGRGGVNRWVETARRLPGDSLLLTAGVSDSLRTFFRSLEVGLPERPRIVSEAGFPAVEVDPALGTAGVLGEDGRKEDDRRALEPVRVPLRVRLYHDPGRREDARYVRAGLEAAGRFARLPLAIEQLETGEGATPAALTFWLSEAPPPASLLGEGEERTVVRDASAAGAEPTDTRASLPESAPSLLQYVPGSGAGVPVWRDGFGRPLLVEARAGNARLLTFHGRFLPSWTGLVLDEAWPAWLLALVRERSGAPALSPLSRAADRRLLPASQVLPRKRIGPTGVAGQPVSRPWHGPLWGVVLVLFATERWMSMRSST